MVHVASLVLLLAQVTPPPPPPQPTATTAPSTSPSPVPSPTPALLATPASIAISPAQQTTVTLANATGDLAATTDAKLVTVTVDQRAHTVVVTATQATGNDVLHVSDTSGARVDVPIRVAWRAGNVPANAVLKVTGSPVDPAWLAQQVQALVTRLTLPQVRPEAQATIAAVTPPPAPLAPGERMQFSVPVQINGNGVDYDVSAATAVDVQNVAVDAFTPSLLFYDDDPERVTQDGVLYRGTIDPKRPVRLYYYHDNGPEPRRIIVSLRAQSQDPASVQVIDASAGPNIDVMSVGHAATKYFLLNKPRNQGTVVDLDGDALFPLHDLLLTSRQGVAGNVGLRVLSGGPVQVTVMALSPGANPQAIVDRPVLPGDGHHRTGTFMLDAFANDALTYAAGGPDAKVVYGDRDPTPKGVDPASGHDYGDYGVLRTVTLTLTNPTPATANAYLYVRPIGGVLRSSFLVDGTLIEVGCVRVPVPYQIAAYTLAPNQTYRLLVQTMTDGGSNYPAEVGVTGTPPQASPPPISAPDGCFPKPQPSASPMGF